ncbi:heme-binding beta-barrel domain-containing protein [Paraburkholderia hayleyella]|uniref:heme-binding beta-barrel domain-containing protein n=1 Tax=Paraburkholderia hayleyella TaxID=2152889 RepID=UPI001290F02E|nr:heme-binding beta-barrel domain-containing protein [Paraburkholderia hayleyella]
MNKIIACMVLALSSAASAQETVINGMDFGPLAKLAGTWKVVDSGGVDLAPGQTGSNVGKGGSAVEPYDEVWTFEPAADATNASDQYLVAMYFKQEAFRKKDKKKFHDQRGYLIYDKKNQMVYDSFCIPRAVCIVAEGKAGDKMVLQSGPQGVAESRYMSKNAKTKDFSISFDISDKTVKYTQKTRLRIYGKSFDHIDTSTLVKTK